MPVKGHGNVSIGNPAPLCGKGYVYQCIRKILSKDRLILVTAQKDLTDEDPLPGRIYSVGVVSQIEDVATPRRQGKGFDARAEKSKIVEYVQETPTFLVRIEPIEEPIITEITLEIEALMRYVKRRWRR